MERLAKAANKPSWKARALIRKAHLQRAQYKEEDSYRTATSAFKFARQSKQRYLEAESLFWLSRNAQTNEESIRLAQQAADLYLSLEEPSRAGRALNIVAAACSRVGRNEDARRIAQTALAMCEQAGDNVGRGWSLNLLSNMEKDLGVGIKLQKQVYQAS